MGVWDGRFANRQQFTTPDPPIIYHAHTWCAVRQVSAPRQRSSVCACSRRAAVSSVVGTRPPLPPAAAPSPSEGPATLVWNR